MYLVVHREMMSEAFGDVMRRQCTHNCVGKGYLGAVQWRITIFRALGRDKLWA